MMDVQTEEQMSLRVEETEARMGTVFTATSKSAEAPDIEPGIYDLRFDGTTATTVKGGQYTKDTVNGDPKLEWHFTVLDEDGDVVYDKGDPVEVQALTGVRFNITAKTVPGEVKVLKAILNAGEFAEFMAGNGTEEETLLGRVVQGEIYIKESGWLGVTNIIPARKSRKVTKASSVDED
jgi:hypothetical protein